MPYLVDSDCSIDYFNDEPRMVLSMPRLLLAGAAISIISYREAASGLELRPSSQASWGRLKALMDSVPVLPVSVETGRRSGRVAANPRRQGRRVRSPNFDLVMTSTALEHGLTLVTHNVDDERGIPGQTLYAPT